MQQFGQYLKSEREKRGVRLEEIASSTKIHIQNLNLMEEDRWKELPQEPFIRGFISAYARYLGLDNKETLKLFSHYQNPPEKIVEENVHASASISELTDPDAEFNSNPQETPQIETSDFKKVEKAPLPKSTQIKAVLAAGVLLGVTLVVMMTRSSTDKSEPEVQVQANNQAVPAVPATPETNNLQPTTPTEPVAPVQTEPPKENSDVPIAKTEIEPPKKESENNPTVQTQANNKINSETPSPAEPKSEAEKPKTSVENLSPSKATTPAQNLASASTATDKESGSKETQPPPAAETQTSNPQKAETVPSANGHEVSVEVKYKSWMKVVIDDAPPKESFLEAGAKANFQAKDKIKIVLGNSSESQVIHNGENSEGKQFLGTIREYIFPKGARFPQDKPKPKPSEESSTRKPETTATTEKNQKLESQPSGIQSE